MSNTMIADDDGGTVIPEGFSWYEDAKGKSRIMAYKIEDKEIHVMFVFGDIYVYTEATVGEKDLMHMKSLAETGQGLSGFINTYVRDKYSDKYIYS
jgi:hypothetical protein